MSLATYGADTDLLNEIATLLAGAPAGTAAGRVSRVDRGRFQLLTAGGPLTVATTGVAPVCVGDWCTVRALPSPGAHGAAFELLDVLPRRTALVRQASGGRTEAQALAANVDVVLVLVPLDRPISPRQVERFLALAWDSGAAPVLVLTKRDLVEADVATAATSVLERLGRDLPLMTVSTVSEEGIDRVATLVQRGQTLALLGPSGSGKSSLVNALMGSHAVQTGDVRQADAKGRHTTTWRELVIVPGGGALLDTPGLRELGMWTDEIGIDSVFSDVTDLEDQCRFSDCAHDSEPGCAVLAAVAAGELPAARLDSYRTLRDESADAARENERRASKGQGRRGGRGRSRDS